MESATDRQAMGVGSNRRVPSRSTDQASVGDTTQPSAMQRRWVKAGILLVIVWQISVPARYYFGGDPTDERFAWRMFSGVRLERCRSQLWRLRAGHPPQAVDLSTVVHPAWQTNLRRNRRRVIAALMRHQCRAEPARSLFLMNTCSDAGGRRLPPRRYAMECGPPHALQQLPKP